MLTKNDLKQIGNLLDKGLDTKVKPVIDRSIRKNNASIKVLVDDSIEGNTKTTVKSIIDTSIKNAFQEFYDSIFEPYVNKNEREHDEMIREIKLLRKDTDEIKDYVKDHDKRIENLENTASIRN